MELIAFLVPIVVTGIMFILKRIAGFAGFANGAEAMPLLRILLVGLSLIGQLSTAPLTGKEIDADSITAIVTVGLVTVLSAYGSHWLYRILSALRTFIQEVKAGMDYGD
jgi:hypothetical protein